MENEKYKMGRLVILIKRGGKEEKAQRCENNTIFRKRSFEKLWRMITTVVVDNKKTQTVSKEEEEKEKEKEEEDA